MIAISETITPLIVTVDASTVRCSAIDYMAPEVKINIPQLKGITLFDHENRGAGGPCMTAGACTADFTPERVIDPEHPEVAISLRINLDKVATINHVEKTCVVSIREQLFSTINGHDFDHTRSGQLTQRSYEDCLLF